MANQQAVKDFQQAWETGFQIVATSLNEVLAEKAQGLAIEAAEPPADASIGAAHEEFKAARSQLSADQRRKADGIGAAPWNVGCVNDNTNPPWLFPKNPDLCAELRGHVAMLKSRNWSPELWRENIVDPVEQHASLWRKFFAEQAPSNNVAPPWDRATDARNKWIYEQAVKGTPWGAIVIRLRSKPKSWERIGTINGIKSAANRYAGVYGLDEPKTRQRGRIAHRA